MGTSDVSLVKGRTVYGDTPDQITSYEGTVADTDGVLGQKLVWPSKGFRQVIHVAFEIRNFATQRSMNPIDGALWTMADAQNKRVYQFWTRLYKVGVILGCGGMVDLPVWLDESYTLKVEAEEMDTNGTPTADLVYIITTKE